MKVALALLLAFAIGAACRSASIPLPAPPMLVGALLVVAMTLGYVVIDRLSTQRAAKTEPLRRPPTQQSDGVQP